MYVRETGDQKKRGDAKSATENILGAFNIFKSAAGQEQADDSFGDDSPQHHDLLVNESSDGDGEYSENDVSES